ncbi:hypothetical protein ACEYW6_03175 [Nostoc sp. UIC 10607]|uniref:hypothetical protein n=1 Tax=Nostoc sp. UIC 10607 TaxID=3045935 RepID=UPI0039A1EC35
MFTKIFFGIGALLAIAFIVLVIIQIKNQKEVSKIWRSLESSPTSDRFTEHNSEFFQAKIERAEFC